MARFTESFIKGLGVTGTTRKVMEGGGDEGFGIQVTAKGEKTFIMRYTSPVRVDHAGKGKRRFLSLGRWPSVTVAEARARCREFRSQVERGEDPQETIGAGAWGTVDQLLDAYLSKGMRSEHKVRVSLKRNVRPLIGGKLAREVAPADIRRVLHPIIARGAPGEADRVRSYLRAAWRHGIHHDNDPRTYESDIVFGLPSENPVDALPKIAGVTPGERVASWDELRLLWNDERWNIRYRLVFQLMLLTGGQRSGEVTRAPKDEFDLDKGLWHLPGSRTKNRMDHLIPLMEDAVAVLERLYALTPGSVWLCPAHHRPGARKPWNESTLAHAMAKHLATHHPGVEPFTPRDLRRTWKSLGGELGIPKQHRDLVQNHARALDVSSRHYDRYDYIAEKRQALETFNQELMRRMRQ